MTTRCTLYSPTIDFDATALLQGKLTGWALDLEGPRAAWTRATFTSSDGTLRLTSLVFTEEGDKFSSLEGSTANYLRREAPGLSQDERASLIDFVWDSQWIVGVVGTADVLGTGALGDAVRALAVHLGARIFDGTHLVLPHP